MTLEAFGHDLREAAEAADKRRARHQRVALGLASASVFVAASALLLVSVGQDDQQVAIGDQPASTADQATSVPQDRDGDVPPPVNAQDGGGNDPSDSPERSESPVSVGSEPTSTDVTESAPTGDPGDAESASTSATESTQEPQAGTPTSTADGSTPTSSDVTQAAGQASSTTEPIAATCSLSGGRVSAPEAVLREERASRLNGITIDGVRLLGFDPEGELARVTFSNGGFAVNGGQRDFQIDYDQELDTSETLQFEFPTPICSATMTLGLLTIESGRAESGRWSALDDQGQVVGSGRFAADPDTRPELIVTIALGREATTLKIEATPNEQGGDPSSDGASDFGVIAVEWMTYDQ